MADSFTTLVVSLIGLLLLLIGFIVLAVKSNGKQVVSWRGFGVTFEIKPCSTCKMRKE